MKIKAEEAEHTPADKSTKITSFFFSLFFFFSISNNISSILERTKNADEKVFGKK
jgi:hypothetical protein